MLSIFAPTWRVKPSSRCVTLLQRSTDLTMDPIVRAYFSRCAWSGSASTRSPSNPAFSLMIARGLLISWATLAAMRPIVASLLVYSMSWRARALRASASLRPWTRRFEL